MAAEVINEIQRAEAKADELIKNAQSDASKITKDAEKKSLLEYKKILDDAKAQRQQIMNDAVAKAEKNTEYIFEEGRNEANNIKKISNEKVERAVNLVIERIVNINGDS